MVTLALFVPFQVDYSFSHYTFEHDLLADRVEEPIADDPDLESSVESAYVGSDAVHLDLVETERGGLSRELLSIEGHIHIELEAVTT